MAEPIARLGPHVSLRLIEIHLPASVGTDVEGLLSEADVVAVWSLQGSVRVLVHADKAEPVLDLIERRFAHIEDYRVVLLPVEATIPRPEAHCNPRCCGSGCSARAPS